MDELVVNVMEDEPSADVSQVVETVKELAENGVMLYFGDS